MSTDDEQRDPTLAALDEAGYLRPTTARFPLRDKIMMVFVGVAVIIIFLCAAARFFSGGPTAGKDASLSDVLFHQHWEWWYPAVEQYINIGWVIAGILLLIAAVDSRIQRHSAKRNAKRRRDQNGLPS